MDDAIAWWREAARRADAMREKIARLARTGVPVSRDLLVELARLEDEVGAKLQQVRSTPPPESSSLHRKPDSRPGNLHSF